MRKLVVAGSLAAALMTMASVYAADVATAANTAVVNVKLADNGHAMDSAENLGLGIGLKGDMSKATMSIDTDRKTVPAGMVTFNVTNISKDTVHEMLVIPLASKDTPLPYISAENRVDEEGSHDLGEVSELDPGKSGSLTLDLKPGLYALVCNIPGHYMAGMWSTITVQ
jgi:uncharacterized cupredoxin-like copper-binding protein